MKILQNDPTLLSGGTESPWFFRSGNSQAYTLNWPQASELKDNFDLIIVVERLEESLVLLKHELCMDWEDLFIKFVNVESNTENDSEENDSHSGDLYNGFSNSGIPNGYSASDSRHHLSEEDKRYARKYLINSDLNLYQRANTILNEKIAVFGKHRMYVEIEELREVMVSRQDVENAVQEARQSWKYQNSEQIIDEIKNYTKKFRCKK